MIKNYSQFLLGVIIGVGLGVLITKQYFQNFDRANLVHAPARSTTMPSASDPVITLKNTSHTNNQIPSHVFEVVAYIQKHHAAMDGYVGGRIFTNRERIVPQRDAQNNAIQYQEWDVNPKVQGQHRDAERILTGSDGRNWYTSDHYKSFIEIK